ncbi:hypothetical protein EVAR_67604_1 [Eumeta japonica]|uniref:Uncharacterized protein n=1 Tax=Eumeta variegata TaxID=151549 RepID=A0A4C1ZR02_EUMVA|nr:hypothetical protein EVAR_67604_1 [Eumeta japonica]
MSEEVASAPAPVADPQAVRQPAETVRSIQYLAVREVARWVQAHAADRQCATVFYVTPALSLHVFIPPQRSRACC